MTTKSRWRDLTDWGSAVAGEVVTSMVSRIVGFVLKYDTEFFTVPYRYTLPSSISGEISKSHEPATIAV